VDKVEIIIADAGSSGKKLEIAGAEPVNTRGAKEKAFNNELYGSSLIHVGNWKFDCPNRR